MDQSQLIPQDKKDSSRSGSTLWKRASTLVKKAQREGTLNTLDDKQVNPRQSGKDILKKKLI